MQTVFKRLGALGGFAALIVTIAFATEPPVAEAYLAITLSDASARHVIRVPGGNGAHRTTVS